jgi:hypothetical protein
MSQQVKQVDGNKVKFEDPLHVHVQTRKTTRAALAAKKNKGPGNLTVDDLHTMLELVLDAQEDLLAKREG